MMETEEKKKQTQEPEVVYGYKVVKKQFDGNLTPFIYETILDGDNQLVYSLGETYSRNENIGSFCAYATLEEAIKSKPKIKKYVIILVRGTVDKEPFLFAKQCFWLYYNVLFDTEFIKSLKSSAMRIRKKDKSFIYFSEFRALELINTRQNEYKKNKKRIK